MRTVIISLSYGLVLVIEKSILWNHNHFCTNPRYQRKMSSIIFVGHQICCKIMGKYQTYLTALVVKTCCFLNNASCKKRITHKVCGGPLGSLTRPGARLTKAYDVTIQRYRDSHAKLMTVKCIFCGVWVQNFVRYFKGALWNFTQNFEPIHRKNMHFTRC